MDDYTAIRSKKRTSNAPALEEAKKFIINQMPEGRRMAKEIKNLAAANKISNMTLQRARDDLGIIIRTTKTFPSKTEWILPGHGTEEPKQVELPL